MADGTMRKFGIFGGTFNPVHWGHLLIAETGLSQFGLDQIIWVPTYQPPHKNQAVLAFDHRLAMVKLAIADHPQFTFADVEQQQLGISYAIVTFKQLQLLYPETNWYWIVGLDALQTLPKWSGVAELVTQCIWLVAPRNLVANAAASLDLVETIADQFAARSQQLHWHLLQMPSIGISSSLIRQSVQQGRSVRYLVPDAVRHYILQQELYCQ
jgi:nicotinate-nucleotide adenylyltransferase